ncbi:MAG: sugar phosphate isomerase/epimerase, partial [Sphingomonadaceae bacterium]
HIHARVGHAQGPQVGDFRAPEAQAALQAHLQWWDRVVALRRAAGAERLTLTPEFGPQPYTPSLPYTNQPVANPWELNVAMLQLLRARYA